MKPAVATTLAALRQDGVVHVTCRGVPLTITRNDRDLITAILRVCPHDWVVMDHPVVKDGCLICPLHLATFDAVSGAVGNTRGKRIHEGLRTTTVQVREQEVLVDLKRADYTYLLKAWARRTTHAVAKLVRRRGRKRGRR